MPSLPLRRSQILLLAAAAALGAVGCGTPSADVSGQVTLEGRPVVVGSVVFFPANQQPVVAPLDAEGRFTAPRIPANEEIRVAVYSEDPAGDLSALPPGPEGEQDRAALLQMRQKWIPIPSGYNDPGRSRLTCKPTPPVSSFDIDLKRAGPPQS